MHARWIQRFENYDRACARLLEALAQDPDALSDLEKEGVIQRFEYTFELAWKTLRDYLEHTGVGLDQVTPRAVIKAAFTAKLIIDGDLWIDMIEKRNMTSHLYNETTFKLVSEAVQSRYAPALFELRENLRNQLDG